MTTERLYRQRKMLASVQHTITQVGADITSLLGVVTATLPVHAGENLGVIKRTKDGHDAEELMAPPP